mgnify:CR=1 FL=1
MKDRQNNIFSPKTMTRVVLVLGLALGVTGLAPVTPEATPAKKLAQAQANFDWEGEELYYKINVNGSEAAHAAVRVGDVRLAKERPYVALSAKAKSVGLFHTIYPMDDRANTFIDPLSFQPIRSEKVFREAGRGRTYKVDYLPHKFTSNILKIYHKDEKNPEDRERKYSRALPNTTHDAFTWFLEIRTIDKFTPGDKLSYYIFDGWKLSRVDLEVIGEERVLTPMGWYNAIRFDFEREILSTKRKLVDRKPVSPDLTVVKPGKPTGSLWLSADSRRLPLKIEMGSTYGKGEVMLAKYVPPKKKKSKRPTAPKAKQ